MTNRKLISVRVEQDLLKKIDKICKDDNSINRSHVINNLLSAMLRCYDGDLLWKIASCYDPFCDGFVILIREKDEFEEPNF